MTESQKPSAIDDLIRRKPISKMTADEYVALARQAQMALEVDRIRGELRDSMAKRRKRTA